VSNIIENESTQNTEKTEYKTQKQLLSLQQLDVHIIND